MRQIDLRRKDGGIPLGPWQAGVPDRIRLMRLPFTHDQFLDVFGACNLALRADFALVAAGLLVLLFAAAGPSRSGSGNLP